jgi:predicted secreted protein
MKQVIVTAEDTNIHELAKILNEEQIGVLLYELQAQGKIFITQWYNDSHAQERGFFDVEHMREVCHNIYEEIDDMISDYEID